MLLYQTRNIACFFSKIVSQIRMNSENPKTTKGRNKIRMSDHIRHNSINRCTHTYKSPNELVNILMILFINYLSLFLYFIHNLYFFFMWCLHTTNVFWFCCGFSGVSWTHNMQAAWMVDSIKKKNPWMTLEFFLLIHYDNDTITIKFFWSLWVIICCLKDVFIWPRIDYYEYWYNYMGEENDSIRSRVHLNYPWHGFVWQRE